MKLFYKYTDTKAIEVIISENGESELQIRTPNGDVQSLVDEGSAVIYDTYDELKQSIQYASDRCNNYPAIEDQFDQIFHEGIDAWKETIQAVKDAHPKPE